MSEIKNIGLALGGGAVLGAAHVGVLKAIEENNIEISYLTGTSIGAFVAALFAFGKKSDEIEKIASELNWFDITKISLTRYGLLTNEKFGELVTEHIGNQNIEDSEIPLAFIATDITDGKRIVLDKGPIDTAVMASTCIPGVFKPVSRNGHFLVDGGIVENLPIKAVKDMGANYIIGVDLNSRHSAQKPENILDVMVNSFHFLMRQSIELQTKDADLIINPDLSTFSSSDTSQIDELMKVGYDTACASSLCELNK